MNKAERPGANPPARIAFLDVARGLGILLVVLGHSPLVWDHAVRFSVIYAFHMPLFFFLSGLFLTPTIPLGKQAIRRANGLLKPYFCIVAALAIAQWTLRGQAPGELVSDMLYGTGATLTWTPLWYLPHLWLATLAAVPIARALTARGRPAWLSCAALALLLILGVYLLRASGATFGEQGLPWSADMLGISLFFLLLGWLAHDTLQINGVQPLTGLLCVVAFTILFLWQPASMDLNLRSYDHLFFSTLAALLGITACLALAGLLARQRLMANVLGYIGQGTLFILIFHVPILWRVLQWLNAHAGGSETLHAWISIVAAIAIPLLCWEVARRNRWLSALMLTQTARPSRKAVQPD